MGHRAKLRGEGERRRHGEIIYLLHPKLDAQSAPKGRQSSGPVPAAVVEPACPASFADFAAGSGGPSG